MRYTIRKVNGADAKIIATLNRLHRICFGNSAPNINHKLNSQWWIVYDKKGKAAGFAGLSPSQRYLNAGYLYRAGILPAHRGHGLQKRLIRLRIRAANVLGWDILFTDTKDSPQSSNNLIACGFTIYEPEFLYSFKDANYWRMVLRPGLRLKRLRRSALRSQATCLGASKHLA